MHAGRLIYLVTAFMSYKVRRHPKLVQKYNSFPAPFKEVVLSHMPWETRYPALAFSRVKMTYTYRCIFTTCACTPTHCHTEEQGNNRKCRKLWSCLPLQVTLLQHLNLNLFPPGSLSTRQRGRSPEQSGEALHKSLSLGEPLLLFSWLQFLITAILNIIIISTAIKHKQELVLNEKWMGNEIIALLGSPGTLPSPQIPDLLTACQVQWGFHVLHQSWICYSHNSCIAQGTVEIPANL